MSKSQPEVWPAFQAPLLNAISSAFLQRRKSLVHRTRSFVATCELESGGAAPPERLNLDAELPTSDGHPIQVRLSVWPDGALWFRICQPAKRGWAFTFAFRGHLAGPSTSELVGWFEESLIRAGGAKSQQQHLLAVWSPVRPIVERAG